MFSYPCSLSHCHRDKLMEEGGSLLPPPQTKHLEPRVCVCAHVWSRASVCTGTAGVGVEF